MALMLVPGTRGPAFFLKLGVRGQAFFPSASNIQNYQTHIQKLTDQVNNLRRQPKDLHFRLLTVAALWAGSRARVSNRHSESRRYLISVDVHFLAQGFMLLQQVAPISDDQAQL